MADSGRWRELKSIVEKQFGAKIQVTSTYRAGSKAAGSSRGDYHSTGDAIDIHSADMMMVFNWLIATFPGTEEVIHTPGGNKQIKNGKPHKYGEPTASGHYDHVHWACLDTARAKQGGTGGAPTGDSGDATAGALGSVFGPISQLFTFFTDPKMWLRVGIFFAGILFVAIGLFIALSSSPAVQSAVKKGVGAAGGLVKR